MKTFRLVLILCGVALLVGTACAAEACGVPQHFSDEAEYGGFELRSPSIPDVYTNPAASGIQDSTLFSITGLSVSTHHGTSYTNYRSMLFFDTSSIPPTAVISNAKLALGFGDPGTSVNWGAGSAEHIYIAHNASNLYPSNPIVDTDYNYLYYTVSTDTSISPVAATGYNNTNNFTFSNDALGFINQGGDTNLVLMTSFDYEQRDPGITTRIDSNSYLASSYKPLLEIDYTIPCPPPSGCTGDIATWTRCKADDIANVILMGIMIAVVATLVLIIATYVRRE